MTKVTIHTQIINQLDGRIIVDNAPGVEIPNYTSETMFANANAFADLLRDCQVTLSASNGDSICIPSRNMMKDEETMEYSEFMAKWYGLDDIVQLERGEYENEKLQWEYMNGEYPEDF